MADSRSLVTARLVLHRARARAGSLLALTATVAAAVAAVILILVVTDGAAALGRAAAPAGTPDDEVAAAVSIGAASLSSALPSLLLTVAGVAAAAVAQLGRLLAAAREHFLALQQQLQNRLHGDCAGHIRSPQAQSRQPPQIGAHLRARPPEGSKDPRSDPHRAVQYSNKSEIKTWLRPT